jgi:hypothetical protein
LGRRKALNPPPCPTERMRGRRLLLLLQGIGRSASAWRRGGCSWCQEPRQQEQPPLRATALPPESCNVGTTPRI